MLASSRRPGFIYPERSCVIVGLLLDQHAGERNEGRGAELCLNGK